MVKAGLFLLSLSIIMCIAALAAYIALRFMRGNKE